MDTGKHKQHLSTPVAELPAPAASVAVSHTASAAAQPADELADSTAQPDVSQAGEAASPRERLHSTTPRPSATAAARASQPSSRPSEVVDLTADDVQSVQQSKSTGVGHAACPAGGTSAATAFVLCLVGDSAVRIASLTFWLMCSCRCSIGNRPVQPFQRAFIGPSSAADGSRQGGQVAADRS